MTLVQKICTFSVDEIDGRKREKRKKNGEKYIKKGKS